MQILSSLLAATAEPDLPGIRAVYSDLTLRLGDDWKMLLAYLGLLQIVALGSLWLAGLVIAEDADNVGFAKAVKAWLVSTVLFVVVLFGAYFARHYALILMASQGMAATPTLIGLLPSIFLGVVLLGTLFCMALVTMRFFLLTFGAGIVCSLIALVLFAGGAFGLKFAFGTMPAHVDANLRGWPGQNLLVGGPGGTALPLYFEIMEKRAGDPKRPAPERAQLTEEMSGKLAAMKTAGPEQTPLPAYFDLLERRASDKARTPQERGQALRELYEAVESLFRKLQGGDPSVRPEYEHRNTRYQQILAELRNDVAPKTAR